MMLLLSKIRDATHDFSLGLQPQEKTDENARRIQTAKSKETV